MRRLALAVAAAASFGAVAGSTANAGIGLQGPQLTGIALQSLAPNQPVVTAVTLASGEGIVLRPATTD